MNDHHTTPDTLQLPERARDNRDHQNLLDNIDFDALKNIAEEQLLSLHIDPSYVKERFIGKDSIRYFSHLEDILNMYNIGGKFEYNKDNPARSNIALSKRYAQMLQFITSENNLGEGNRDAETVLLSILCHEEAHALSHRSHTEWSTSSFLSEISKERSGIASRTIERSKLIKKSREVRDILFLYANEGITDLFGESLFAAYTKNHSQKHDYITTYDRSRELVKTFIRTAATECNCDPRIIWQTILKTTILGGDLTDKKAQKVFGNIFPEHFWHKLSKSKDTAFSTNRLIKIIESSEWTDTDKKRLQRWINSFLKKPYTRVTNDDSTQ